MMMSMRRMFTNDRTTKAVQPRVTPDPQHAHELAKRFSKLAYCPETAFHRDRMQERKTPMIKPSKRK